MVYTRFPRDGRHFRFKSANSHRDGPPEPGILVSVAQSIQGSLHMILGVSLISGLHKTKILQQHYKTLSK